MRFAWNSSHDSLPTRSLPQRLLFEALLHRIRQWARDASARVDSSLSISEVTRRRVLKFYGRDSQVLYPPIDASAFHIAEKHDDFFLIVSALQPYKRVDIAVEAFTRLGRPLK